MPEVLQTPLLEGRLALVTGAAAGIGRAIARCYARAGARVVLTDLSEAACQATVSEIHAAGGQAWAFALDVTDVPACASLAERVGREIGPLDVLVNNAGILLREGIETPEAHRKIRQVFDVNVLGGFNVLHAFLPALRRTRGCVINIASGAAFIAQAGCIGYSGSKGAVKMLTQSMAVDLARDGIRVNAIAPGGVETPMTGHVEFPEGMDFDLIRKSTAHGFEMIKPEEPAALIAFLVSDEARAITGTVIPIDLGITT